MFLGSKNFPERCLRRKDGKEWNLEIFFFFVEDVFLYK